MPELVLRTIDGDEKTVPNGTLDVVAAGLRGALVAPGEPGYDEARTTWNAMIDRRPGLIVRCMGTGDVRQAVRFSREHGLLTAVRGGGHHIAGNSVCDGGLLIDLSSMKSVRVDPRARTARVEPGVTLAGFDRETQAFALATPVGINSTTGIAGLTLGGGFGWLSRERGLTIDNLTAADVVTADGELVFASEEENADLFWALRGGSGNFGVVTSFEYGLHELGPEVLSGLVVHPFEDARDVLERYRIFAAEMPDEANAWFVIRKAPPLPFLPEEVHGTLILILPVFHPDVHEGERVLAPLRSWGEPIADVVAPHPYVAWQSAFDPLLTPGARNYWKSHNFAELSDGAFDTILEHAESLPSDQSEIFVGRLGGAVNRVAADATAYPHRDVEYVMNVHTRWESPSDDDHCVAWARALFDAMAPHAMGSVYVNFMPEDEVHRVKAAFGRNYDRLAEIKGRYDPDNFFRLNQNIAPR